MFALDSSLTLRQHLQMIDQAKHGTRDGGGGRGGNLLLGSGSGIALKAGTSPTTSEASTTSSTHSHDDSASATSSSSLLVPSNLPECPNLLNHRDDYANWNLPPQVQILALDTQGACALQVIPDLASSEWDQDSLLLAAHSTPSLYENYYCSIQAPVALPKPVEYTRVMHVAAPPVNLSSCWGRALFGNKSKRRKLIQQQLMVKPTTSSLEWKPFVMKVVQDDGSTCHLSSLVSYFEVNILSKPKPQQDHSMQQSSVEHVDQEQEFQVQASESLDESFLHVFEDALSMDATYTDEEKQTWPTTGAEGTEQQHPPVIAIGIGTPEFLEQHDDADIQDNEPTMPGWDPHSIAYHGDDGALFGLQTQQVQYGPTFGPGDTIGCGLDYRHERVFFTKNAVFLGYGQLPLTMASLSQKWKPTVGFDVNAQEEETPPPIQFNLQGPFQFDLPAFLQQASERCYL